MSQEVTGRVNSALEGRYRIERELGAGGMATVYLAQDVKHDRKVALKILRPDLAAVMGADRFLSEIKTTANLQHPHILPLHDSGDADGFLFYVMPYVEGESLRARMDREKQLSVDEAIRITKAVASALDYAHRQGVIHRDVKPENVLMHDGQPLVADFGIALAVSAAGAGRLTETGLSLGTPYYMSPEQATADRDPGPQSDVYSLACMLYEMLVGDPPHTGSSAQAVLAKILTERPRPVTQLRQTVPPHVGNAVSKALERLPADRFDSAEAFSKALDDAGFTHVTVAGVAAAPAQAGATGRPGGARRWTSALPWALAALAVGWALWGSLQTGTPPAPVTRVYLTAPEGQEPSRASVGPAGNVATLAPDGSQIVYVGGRPDGGGSQLWRRSLDALESTPIPATEGGRSPAFSKDGAFLAFLTEGDRLGVMPAQGGVPVWLAGGSYWYSWGDDGAIYFTEFGETNQIMRWVPGTARAEPRVTLDTPAVVFDVLPGSDAILLGNPSTVFVVDLDSGETRELAEGRSPRYLPTGHIVYLRGSDNALLAEPFDLASLTTAGTAISTSAVVVAPGNVGADYAVAPDGTLVYMASGARGGEELVWVDRAGATEAIDWIDPGQYDGIALDPDGRRIAAGWVNAGSAQTDFDIWVFDLRERSRLALTRNGQGARPQWHPVNGRISYVESRAGGPPVVMILAADGSGTPEEIAPFNGAPADAWWTRDGAELLMRMPGVSTRGIFRFLPGEGDPPQPWLDRAFNERNPAPSPDGNWLVYVSDQSGRDEVYAQPYPDGGAVVAISIDGGSQAVWSRDGREVFFVGADGFMWSATVAFDASTFRVESRERLFEVQGRRLDIQRPLYDVAPDGRFLFSRPVGAQGGNPMVLVRNWMQEVTGVNQR